MTAVSGFSRNFVELGLARVGVGIGEATATPCAYSLISDSFPPHRRATALGVYSAGLYVGGGVSLFLGSSIAQGWDHAFAGRIAPLGLAGWQAAFLAVGLPGLLLALWVATLREPLRGRFEISGPQVAPAPAFTGSPLGAFLREAMDVIPPLTVVSAGRRGAGALTVNLFGAAFIAAIMASLAWLTGDIAQWLAFGLGCYSVYSWGCALRYDSPDTYRALLKRRPFLALTASYSLVTFVGYAITAFMPLYAIEVLGADPTQAGFVLGGAGALGGVAGVIVSGMAADRLAKDGNQGQRILVIAASAMVAMVCHTLLFTTSSLAFYYALTPIAWIFLAATLGGSSATLVNIIQPGLRGTATAAFLLGPT
jgi:MFS family permease